MSAGANTTDTAEDWLLLRQISALGNPHRLRLIAVLAAGRMHVSALARELGISRPTLYELMDKLAINRNGLEKSE